MLMTLDVSVFENILVNLLMCSQNENDCLNLALVSHSMLDLIRDFFRHHFKPILGSPYQKLLKPLVQFSLCYKIQQKLIKYRAKNGVIKAVMFLFTEHYTSKNQMTSLMQHDNFYKEISQSAQSFVEAIQFTLCFMISTKNLI